MLQTSAVETPGRFDAVAIGRGDRPPAALAPDRSSSVRAVIDKLKSDTLMVDGQLVDKLHVERVTSFDITTIYRKIKAGSFPQPVRIDRRRVAWRTADIVQ
jgi:predicted DNA-binding transcriptional regulator AlpA